MLANSCSLSTKSKEWIKKMKKYISKKLEKANSMIMVKIVTKAKRKLLLACSENQSLVENASPKAKKIFLLLERKKLLI